MTAVIDQRSGVTQMSDFNLFEADEAAQSRPQLQARTAARKMEAAIDVVRAEFGRFLLGATGIDEFGDRWHYSKHDIRQAVEPYVFPNTGTMRRIHNALKQDWKLAHPYKLAEDRDAPIQDIDETFSPSSGNLIPEGNFDAYEDSVDQGGPEKVQRDFGRGGDTGSDRHAAKTPEDHERKEWMKSYGIGEDSANELMDEQEREISKREAARLVADIYTDFARANGLRVASLDTLDRYAATGIAPADYDLLGRMIVAACECDDEGDDSDSDSDSEAPSESESDDSDSDDGSDEAPDFGGEDDAEDDADEDHEEPDADNEGGPSDGDADNEDDDDFPGGEQFTVPEQAPELDPQLQQEIPADDPQGSAPIPPEVIDSLLGLPEGTIEQLLLEEVEKQGLGGGEPQAGPPQGGGDDFFGEGGGESEQEPPRVANRRRRVAKDYGRKCPECKSTNTDYSSSTNDYDCYDCGATFKPYSNSKKSPEKESRLRQARQFWAADDESSSSDSSGSGDSSGGGQQAPAQPQQDPNAMMGGGQQVDPTAMGMGQPMLPPPGSQAVQPPAPAMPLENQPAEDALLDTANQAIMQMIDRETQEYQQIIDPLSQALQAIQFAQSVEQAEHPLDVTPPQGSVDVSPAAAPGGAQNPMQPTAARRQAAPYLELKNDEVPGVPAHNQADQPRAFWDAYAQHREDGFHPPSAYARAFAQHGVAQPLSDRQAKIRTALRGAARVIAQRYRLSATGERMLLEAMGRRNYEHVREALSLVPPEVRRPAAIHMGEMFAADNPRFNKDVWMRSVLASNPRDRAGDAWRSGRDRGVAEHGRQDLADAQAEDEQNHWEDDPEYRKLYQGSRGRLPFDRPRLAGETWTNTPTQDAFEFPNAGKTPRVDDGIGVNNLPKMTGADPHAKNASARHAKDIVHKLQNWLSQQQARGLNYGGDVAAERFLSQHPNVGPRATQIVHQTVGAEPHPPSAVGPSPKASTPKAVNPVTKRGSFFTRKVPGWKWDDHLSGYVSKEGKAFTCLCGQKVAAPSYKSCDCGKIWNITALGSTQHLASDTADFYVAREIPVRPGVILAGKNMESGMANLRLAGEGMSWEDTMKYIDRVLAEGEPEEDSSSLIEGNGSRWCPACQSEAVAPTGNPAWPGEHECHDCGASWMSDSPFYLPGKKAEKSHQELLAMIDKLADWTIYDSPDPSREGGPKKPPSTTIPKQPRDWAKRTPEGTWQGPAIPRKKK